MKPIRLAFFSDVHGNSAALRRVLDDIDAREIGRSFCLGDLVGYGPDPNGVIEMLRDGEIPVLAGNYDDGVGHARGECGCYYADDEARRQGEASYEFTVRAVTAANKAWLRGLPRERHVVAVGHRLHLVHGSPRRINEYLGHGRDDRTYRRLAAAEEPQTAALVFGHTHVPWHRIYDGLLFVNAGSVGRPKDGDVRAAYTLLELTPGEDIGVEVVRVEYDVEQTARGIEAAGLPVELADAFREGR